MARKARIPSSESVKRNAERTYQRFLPKSMLRTLGISGKQTYNYVYGITPGGKQVFWGPMPEDQAEAAAVGLIAGEIFYLDTRDLRKATQAIKAELLKRGNDPDRALGRIQHTGLEGFLESMKSTSRQLKHSITDN